jgi:hypothetical protein
VFTPGFVAANTGRLSMARNNSAVVTRMAVKRWLFMKRKRASKHRKRQDRFQKKTKRQPGG